MVLVKQGDRNRAVGAFREALRADPKLAAAHTNLGNALTALGQWKEALASYRRAAELAPREASAHTNLGLALFRAGDLDGAIAEHRKAVALGPTNSLCHVNLGVALINKGDRAGAVAAFRKAAELEPGNINAHGALGEALLGQGQAAEALEATRAALRLVPEDHPVRQVLLRQRRQCDRTVVLVKKLNQVEQGKAKPASADEGASLAELALRRGRPALATRLYEAAFTDTPALVEQPVPHRFNAACAAGLAGTGQMDGDDRDDGERARLRRQALVWLTEEQKHCQAALAKEGSNRSAIVQTLAAWLREPRLAALRDKDSLARLPARERGQWQKLWADIQRMKSGG
jgi:tetratricopeptide (TPR) repeat protein